MAPQMRTAAARRPGRSPIIAIMLGSLASSTMFLLFQGGKLAFMVFVIVAVLNTYLLMGRWSGIKQVKGQRHLQTEHPGDELEAGTSLRVRISIQIPGFWPVPYVMIRDRLVRNNGGSQEFQGSVIPDWMRKGTLEYVTPPLLRGYYRFGSMDCSTKDIFGLFEHSGSMDIPLTFKVKPQTVPIKEWKQLHRVLKGDHHHAVHSRANRETTQINGVREYSYGDRLSRIHWNATAKTGTLKSKEFEKEALPKTIIYLEREKKNYRSAGQFELGVSVAASLIQYGKHREISLGLFSAGADSSFFETDGSQNGAKGMIHHLIEVAADGHNPLQKVLEERSRLLEPGSCMIIISPLKGDPILKAISWLHQRRIIVCHIWLTDQGEEGAAWCRKLQSIGHMGYAVRSLEELPASLRGVANG